MLRDKQPPPASPCRQPASPKGVSLPRSIVMRKSYEPSLEEIFAEGAVRQLMASDGVSEAALRALLGKLRQSRESLRCGAPDGASDAL
jgi:hypothetical protein